jgi:argininosuccinate lyase
LLATDLVDYLVRKGVPFRAAHHVVGLVVALAEKRGLALSQLTLEDLRSVDKSFDREALRIFDLEKAMARRNLVGAPRARGVRKQLMKWEAQLA